MGKLLNYVKIIVFFILIISSKPVLSQTVYLVSPSNGTTDVAVPVQFNWSGWREM